MESRRFFIKKQLTSQYSGLIIGCGNVHFHSSQLHPSHQFYTLDLLEDIDPDIVGCIKDPDVQRYLSQHKFNLVCIECVPALIFGTKNLSLLIRNMFALLDDNGALIILSCGNMLDYDEIYTPLLEEVQSFTIRSTYRTNSAHHFPTCTIIAAKSEHLNHLQKSYLELALEEKHLNNDADTVVKTSVVSRPAVRNECGQPVSISVTGFGQYQTPAVTNSQENSSPGVTRGKKPG